MSKEATFSCRVNKETRDKLYCKNHPKWLISSILEAIADDIQNISAKYTKAVARHAKRIAREVVKEDRVCTNKLLDDDMK